METCEPLVTLDAIRETLVVLKSLPWPLALMACLSLVGVLAGWTATFILLIRGSIKNKVNNIPLLGLAMMWSFEYTFTLVWPPTDPVELPLRIIEWPWLAMDTVLVVCWVLFADKGTSRMLKALTAGAVLTLTTVLYQSFAQQFNVQDPISGAVIIGAYISVAYVPFVMQAQEPQQLSMWAQRARFLADAATTGVVLLLFVENVPGSLNVPVIRLCIAVTLAADVLTLVLLKERRIE
ncbi:hypothetical protein COV06_01140 [Candidatus Uhrbacteria bacterium CG10_big_fil_rev_8_21_14_0_10_50_16]|uniref:Uncharacterized protein n=1 Tax=Candidatus Uhrbacteria bacterium CG10_big_fil_rev_8_21_14_0_10_50_16 TaxID=1975039 RepID=A0A2H0RNA3_9BACT|nr:MAG: hypothetical protein COV06_01140 [Candidatus Uhrbacteria bacterium CG10_big_fil_rev_8_21_14_0_10_50_16]